MFQEELQYCDVKHLISSVIQPVITVGITGSDVTVIVVEILWLFNKETQ